MIATFSKESVKDEHLQKLPLARAETEQDRTATLSDLKPQSKAEGTLFHQNLNHNKVDFNPRKKRHLTDYVKSHLKPDSCPSRIEYGFASQAQTPQQQRHKPVTTVCCLLANRLFPLTAC